jgi:hypothetical protein
MFSNLTRSLLFVFVLVWWGATVVPAQDVYYTSSPSKPKLDSSSIYGRIKSHYYIRAEASTFRVRSRITGDEFYSVAPFGLNAKGGLVAGFNYRNKWEVEIGLKRLGVYTSHQFDLHKSFGARPGTFDGYKLRINYQHVPVVGKMVVWRPSSKLNVLGTIGIGYTWYRNDGISFAGPMGAQAGVGMPDGSMLSYTISRNSTKKNRFITGEVGLEFDWFFVRKLGLTVAAKRLIGPATVLRLESQLVEGTQGTTYNVSSQTGANGTSLLAGLRYRLY